MSTPEHEWIPALRKMNFSKPAAEAMAKMTKIMLNADFRMKTKPHFGKTTLEEYILELKLVHVNR